MPSPPARLTVVQDGLGNKLTLQRDYTNRVQSIENALGQKHAVALSRFGNLLALEPVGGVPVGLEYLDDISGKLSKCPNERCQKLRERGFTFTQPLSPNFWTAEYGNLSNTNFRGTL